MSVVIEPDVWEPDPVLYGFFFFSCCLSIFLYPHFSKSSSRTSTSLFEYGMSPSFTKFQRKFLFVYSLASVLEGMWSVFGEYELAYYGISREQMVLTLCAGSVAALLLGTLFGVLSDLIGHKKVCIIYCLLHFFIGMWKRITFRPSVWIASTCLSVCSTIYFFSFETWMVVEHEKLGHRLDTLNETFWLMAFFESASYIGSQVLANWMVGSSFEKSAIAFSTAAKIVSIVVLCCIGRGWTENLEEVTLKEYMMSIGSYIFCEKRILLLVWAQACFHFSIAVFWLLWAPTLVADGREVHLGLIYPCLLGAKMLGSTTFQWLSDGLSSYRTEDCLVYAFSTMGFLLAIVAYDYQEIGLLLVLFCLFHYCVGLVLPSLAKLRTTYVPNKLRGGMMGLSQVPVNAVMLLFLVQGAYYRNIGNAAILAFAAFGLFSAAGCMHVLKRLGKKQPPFQNRHKL